jgi:hypothetical protein
MMQWEDRFDLVREKDAAWISERLHWHKLMPLAAALHDPGRRKCPTLSAAFQEMLLRNLSRERHYLEQVKDVFALFEGGGIPCIPYKGPFWGGQIYPEYSWRHIGDIDLLMSLESARAAAALLKRRGYFAEVLGETEDDDFRNRGELTLHPVERAEQRVPVQLHWELLPAPRFLKRHFMSPDDFVTGATVADWRSIRFPLPGAEIRLLYYLLHATCQHQFNRFVLIADVALFIGKHPGLDWKRFLDLARERGCLVPLHYGLSFVGKFGSLPPGALELIALTRPKPGTRFLAGWLTAQAILHATARHGRTRRKLFRFAMSA